MPIPLPQSLAASARRVRDWLTRRSVPAQPGEPAAHITIGTTVIAAQPERFGVNVEVFDYEPWSANATLFNTWTTDAGMEPLILRLKGTATGGGEDWLANDAGPTTTAGDTVGDGFFDGAEARVYRRDEQGVRLLRAATVARYLASEASGYRILLDRPGPPVQAGDVYFLSIIRDDAPVDCLHPSRADLATADTWRVFPNWGDNRWVVKRRDRSTVAPAHGSQTSLRVTLTQAGEGGLVQFIAGSPQPGRLNAFTPGRPYQLDLWLKQEGVRDGKVRVWFYPYRERISQVFTVTGDWARYRFTFRGPRRLPREAIAQLNITCQGPGTFWVDNVRLYDPTQPPYALHPAALQALREFRPGTLRIWSGQTNRAWGTTLDNWLAPEGEGMRFWEPGRGPGPGSLFNLPTALRLARSLGAVPWLIVHPSFDEREWLNLVEYLAGPPDSPYGGRRAAHGQVQPWTDEFSQLRIEYGNETWNPLFQPWTFDNGTQYGQFAEYFWRVAQSSPYYTPVAHKLRFVLGGFLLIAGPTSYGARARKASPSASVVATTSYVSGWDWRQIPAETVEDKFRHTLLYVPWVMRYLTDQQAATRNLLTKMGLPYSQATAEGGAEYGLPSPGMTHDPQEELFGKSLAAGVSTLDAFLDNTAKGYGPQAYHAFGLGAQWTSHTTWRRGFRPHPAWLALALRNRYVEGDMVAVTVEGGPTLSRPELQNTRYTIPACPALPLIGAYAFRHGARTSVFVLSRRLDVVTPVTLHLPVVPRHATLYTLAGDPRANNLDRLRVQVRQRELRAITQDYTFPLPPGSIYLFVID